MLTNAVKLGLIIPALYTFVKNFRLVSLAILCNPRGNMLGQSIFDCILRCRFNIFLPIKATPFRKQFWNFKWIITHLWASAFSTNFRGKIPGPSLMEWMGMRKLFALELCARQNSSPCSFYHTSRYRKATGMRGPFDFVNSTYPKTQSDSGSLLRFVIVTLILRLFLAQLFYNTFFDYSDSIQDILQWDT